MLHAGVRLEVRQKTLYKKWDPMYQQTALDMAFEKGSDRVAVSALCQMFPKVFGDVYESHIRYWREQAQKQAVVVRSPGERQNPDKHKKIND